MMDWNLQQNAPPPADAGLGALLRELAPAPLATRRSDVGFLLSSDEHRPGEGENQNYRSSAGHGGGGTVTSSPAVSLVGEQQAPFAVPSISLSSSRTSTKNSKNTNTEATDLLYDLKAAFVEPNNPNIRPRSRSKMYAVTGSRSLLHRGSTSTNPLPTVQQLQVPPFVVQQQQQMSKAGVSITITPVTGQAPSPGTTSVQQNSGANPSNNSSKNKKDTQTSNGTTSSKNKTKPPLDILDRGTKQAWSKAGKVGIETEVLFRPQTEEQMLPPTVVKHNLYSALVPAVVNENNKELLDPKKMNLNLMNLNTKTAGGGASSASRGSGFLTDVFFEDDHYSNVNNAEDHDHQHNYSDSLNSS